MHRSTIRDIVSFILLVAVGVATRVWFQDIPNFAPVAALALFAGYFFTSRALAIATPLAVMMISDRFVDAGGYAIPLMLTVYALLALPVLFRGVARRHLSLDQGSKTRVFGAVTGLMACSLACSLIFFLGTNFMVWATSSWYEPTLAGLVKCYAGAIPFFRYTLAGDAVFGTLFFGSYAVAKLMAKSTDAELATAA